MEESTHSSQSDVKEFLRPILFGLAEEDLDALATAAVVLTPPAGTVLFNEGDQGDAAYFVVNGEVEVFKQLDDNTERHLHFTGPGEFFGEMAMLQEKAGAIPRSASIRTSKPSTILEIAREPFLLVLGRSPSLAIRLMIRLTRRLRESDQQAIKELRQTNAELTAALRQLAQLDRTKSDFIQVVAHELRTPVAALMGYAQIMQSNPTVENNAELRPLVEGVKASTERLHRIFNNILDVSKVITDELHVRRNPVSIALILRGVYNDFSHAIAQRRLQVDMIGLEELPFYPADPDLMYKAFYHLVSNAVKYTPDGGQITIKGHMVDAPELGPCIEVSVQDTGIGIDPDDIDLIFEKFYRKGEVALHSSGIAEFKGGGPGLGLTIAQGAVLAHGGRIWAESAGYDEAKCPGSRFIVQLPLN